MDSKLQKTAILASMAVILLVSALVLYLNRSSSRPAPGEETPSPPPTVNGAAGGQIGNNLQGFLGDSTFFDPEPNPVLDQIKDSYNRLSMVITSVQRDLRIQIVDVSGKPVAGEGFYVELEGRGRYKDLDRDGVIYISDLEEGNYSVRLLPLGEYRVSENAVNVRVKDRVEYLAIEDIALLLKTEEEIDAGAEDTAVPEALADADRTEIWQFQKPVGAKTGIDVSGRDGEIDWEKVREAGVQFVIVRAGYRGSASGCLVEDPCFKANIKGAAAAGLPVGVYFFTQALNEVEAVEEASAVLQLIREYWLDYPVFIDVEGAGGDGRADGLGAKERTLVCEAFCKTVESEGYRAGVCSGRKWLEEELETERLLDHAIWLAEHHSSPRYQGYYDIWQYTSKGKISGIPGEVHIDISYME